MAEWTTTPTPKPTTEYTHTATVEGLAVEVKQHDSGWITWRVTGYLADLDISASDYHFDHRRTVEQAKDAAAEAAHRLYVVGVRGEKYDRNPYDDATHILAGMGFVSIEDGQNGRYVIVNDGAWWVVDRGEDRTGAVLLYHFDVEQDARDCADNLNQDPEVQPITGPTDAEEAEKSCPECGHPMMSGPLRVKQRGTDDRWVAAWWCANCHYSIEALTNLGIEGTDAEEEALARADHERETAASESGEEA